MRILITGATGLVGQGVLRECLHAADVTAITALGRRPTGIADARLEELLCTDFSNLEAVRVRSPHRALDLFYRVGGPFMGLALNLLPGQMTTTAHVGRAMLALAREHAPPSVVENQTINRLGRQSAHGR